MDKHPMVLAAMHEAIDLAGAGGTCNISGSTCYHVALEAGPADARQGAALLRTRFSAP